jgi:N-acetylmuramoyl-L-alanine amidase
LLVRLLPALVAVDVGHYHAEPGVISASGIAEFEFNLQLAREVKQDLERLEFKVRMIGDKGNMVFLNHRTRAAAGAELLVSIHHDSMRESVIATKRDALAGFSLFVSRRNPRLERSLACASAIGSEMRAAGFKPSRYHADPVIGENRPFADEVNGVHYYDNLGVAKTAKMAALLVEAGVIANRAEEKRMLDPQVRARVARAVAQGVAACLR